MKMIQFLGAILISGLFVMAGIVKAEAGELKVNGFADIIITGMDEGQDDFCLDADGDPANCTELKTDVTGEVDFEYGGGPATVRFDLDFPGAFAVIEQAHFRWSAPIGKEAGLALTAGRFNAPIGFELQDAPDMLQTTNGQLFDLVPSNLDGVMISGGVGMLNLDIYYVDEWRANDGEENSAGALLTVSPVDPVALSVGYLTSPEGAGDENVLDVVLQGTLKLNPEMEALGVVEFLQDENNTAYAVVLNAAHNSPNHPHGITLRYDSVDCDALSGYCGAEATPTSWTVAIFLGLAENLGTVLEWKTFDPDVSDSIDSLLLEFVATF